ncbi:MAG: NUDIX hydrolase [Clostridiales bacterium]|nr:NUDIX hydrolase [Clostridiales bacterium]
MGYIMDLRKELGHRALIMAGGCVLFVNEKNEILLQHRADNHYWGYPGGSMELGESFEECAKREAFEETGLVADELEYFSTESGASTHYIYPNGDEIYVAGIVFSCRKYHGEMKVQEDEVIEQRFFSEEDLPDNMDPLNEEIIHQAFRYLNEGRI